MNLAGRTAIVTGGAHRVGGAITRALAAEGANVVIHYGRSAEAAELLANELEAQGTTTAIVSANLTEPTAPRAIFDVAQSIGDVSVLVNSAAGFPEDRLGELDRDTYRRTLSINLDAPVFMMDEFARRLPEGLGGVVANITDWRINRPYGNHFSYLVAKGALVTMTRAAAIHLAPDVRVNAVALGAILPPPGESTDYLDRLAQSIPVRRAGGSEAVVSAIVEQMRNDFVTGQIWELDGGASLA